jgi:hypothetical protein
MFLITWPLYAFAILGLYFVFDASPSKFQGFMIGLFCFMIIGLLFSFAIAYKRSNEEDMNDTYYEDEDNEDNDFD